MKNSDISSLLPYLEPSEARFCLKISEDASETSASPFLTVSESGITRLIKASFVTDAGSDIKEVFLLIQRDEYRLANNEHPITNQDVWECWQRRLSCHSQHSYIMLADQIGKDRQLLPFQPLFYCKATQRFFHPPCPNCGFPLQECNDDKVLNNSGLQPYSTSLKRYLFCPTCMDSDGASDFYVSFTDDHDPGNLKDPSDMIKGFSKQRSISRACRFPCPECDNFQDCYGQNMLAESRIIPFSFYSFFMLIFESESVVSASDFLSMISAEKTEDNFAKEGGPTKNISVHNKDESHFPEILYLKISFLSELVKNILPNLDNYAYPDLGLSLDRIWIRISEPPPFSPFLLNLGIAHIDMGESPLKTPFLQKSSPDYGRYFLWTIWFFTLLVNRKQDINKTYRAIEQSVGDVFSGKTDYYEHEAFFPENIFWNPEGKKVNEAYQKFWKKSLGLGWTLFRTADSDKDEFLLRLETLREEVRQHLFRRSDFSASATPEEQNIYDNDKAVHDILLNIMDKWRTEFEVPSQEPETISEHPSWDMPTKILRPHDIEQLLEQTDFANNEAGEDDIPKTRIISPTK